MSGPAPVKPVLGALAGFTREVFGRDAAHAQTARPTLNAYMVELPIPR